MKIHQLPEGARFEYEGEEHLKSGPMFATGRNGRRMIPRYAVLKPLGALASEAPPAKGDMLPRARVLAAFAAYDEECARQLPPEQRAALAAARERFLAAIG